MPEKLERQIIERTKDLDRVKDPWRNRWQDVVDYVAPSRTDFNRERTSGEEKTTKIYDSTPTEALNTLAAGFMGYHTSQTTPWFSLVTADRALMEHWEVKYYLEEVTRQLQLILQRSNFYPQMHEFYLDLGGFGTSVLYAGEDPKDILYFKSCGVQECALGENYRGLVDTLSRQWKPDVRQMAQQFGLANLSKDAQKCWHDGNLAERFEVMQIVFPLGDYQDARLPKHFPYPSVYMETGSEHLLSVRGYYEFPFMVTRWSKNTGQNYGYSPIIDQMPNIKTLNAQERSIIKAGAKSVEPPLDVPPGYRGRVKTAPSALNYRSKGKDKISALYDIAGNVPVGIELRNQKRDEIKSACYSDVFMMLANLQRGQMTIPELMERIQEKLIILGPVLGRLHFEATGPIIERSFGLMARAYPPILPMPPEILLQTQAEIELEYVSTLAKAQRAAEGRSTAEALNMLLPLAQLKPQILDKINEDEYADYIWEIHGAPTKLLNADAVVKGIREQRAAEMAELKQKEDAAMMMQGAESAAKIESAGAGSAQ